MNEKRTNGWYDHVYVSTNDDSSLTVESTSSFYDRQRKKYANGIRSGERLNYNRRNTTYYLQLKLTYDRSK